MCLCTLPTNPHSPSYHLIPISFFSILARNLNNALWKIKHNCKNHSLPLSQTQVSFYIFTEVFYESACWQWKYMFLHPPGKKCGGPENGLKLDLMNITSYIILRTIYLQFVFSIHWNISYAIIITIINIKFILVIRWWDVNKWVCRWWWLEARNHHCTTSRTTSGRENIFEFPFQHRSLVWVKKTEICNQFNSSWPW